MSTFLQETLGVADSGVMWDVGNFKLWQSTRPNIILFITKQPELVKNERGVSQMAVSTYTQQQPDRSMKITGGSAAFTLTSAIQWDARTFKDVQDSWRAAIGPNAPRDVKFVPLNIQKGKVQLDLSPASGTAKRATETDVGTPGGTVSFFVNLTELGAQEWAQAIKGRTRIPGSVYYRYQYLRNMPPVGARVQVHGRRVFQHLSAALNVSYNGIFYGGSAKIEAAWNDLQRNGDVEVIFFGDGLPPDLERMRQELTRSFAEQARQMLFDQIFRPMPDVKPAQAGSSGGIFGGANFALKWQRDSDAIDLEQEIRFEGLTWLDASMDTDLGYLFRDVDSRVLTEVATQQAFDSSIVVDADDMLSNVALSVTYSEGHSPEAPVFSSQGGTQRYTVFSQKPNNVKIKYIAKVDYTPARWPIIQTQDEKTVAQGGNQIVINTSQWVGRHEFYMIVRDGNEIVPPTELTEDDYLVLNVSYSGPHLKTPVRDSAHLSGLSMVEFFYPLDPAGGKGEAKFSCFGVLGGKLVRSQEQVIESDEIALFVLATRDGQVQLVSSRSILPESDELAQRLLEGRARPLVKSLTTTGPSPEGGQISNGASTNGEIEGTVVAVEYGFTGPALWIEKDKGGRQRIRLRHDQEARPFDESPRHVRVRLDETGTYADSFVVELSDK